MSELLICKEIRRVGGGYTIQLRHPYGPEVIGCGTVVCRTWDEVLKKITDANIPHAYENDEVKG